MTAAGREDVTPRAALPARDLASDHGLRAQGRSLVLGGLLGVVARGLSDTVRRALVAALGEVTGREWLQAPEAFALSDERASPCASRPRARRPSAAVLAARGPMHVAHRERLRAVDATPLRFEAVVSRLVGGRASRFSRDVRGERRVHATALTARIGSSHAPGDGSANQIDQIHVSPMIICARFRTRRAS